MSEVVKKASILHRLKNIVAKTKRILSWQNKVKDDHISPIDAQNIQQDVYNYIKNLKHNAYTPPYIELAAQLLVPEQQIFEAAAIHLTTIAKSRSKYSKEIKMIFSEVISGGKLSEEKINFLNDKMNEF